MRNATGIAKNITGELRGQKEKVLKTKDKVYEIDADLSGSNNLLNGIKSIKKKQLYIFYTIVVTIVIFLIYQLSCKIF